MQAFKCDICGAYYEPYNYYLNQDYGKPNAVILGNKNDALDSHLVCKSFDACPSCMGAVMDLIKKRKSEE